jgi:hypothetical protein
VLGTVNVWWSSTVRVTEPGQCILSCCCKQQEDLGKRALCSACVAVTVIYTLLHATHPHCGACRCVHAAAPKLQSPATQAKHRRLQAITVSSRADDYSAAACILSKLLLLVLAPSYSHSPACLLLVSCLRLLDAAADATAPACLNPSCAGSQRLRDLQEQER